MPRKLSITPPKPTLQSRFANETADLECNAFLNERFNQCELFLLPVAVVRDLSLTAG